MEKILYDRDGAPIAPGAALQVRADVMLPNSAVLHAKEPGGATIGMLSVCWDFTNPDALEKLVVVLNNFVSEFRKAEASKRDAANDPLAAAGTTLEPN